MNFQDGGPQGSLFSFGHCRSWGFCRLFLNWVRILRSFGSVIVWTRESGRRKMRRRRVVVWFIVVVVVVHLRE